MKRRIIIGGGDKGPWTSIINGTMVNFNDFTVWVNDDIVATGPIPLTITYNKGDLIAIQNGCIDFTTVKVDNVVITPSVNYKKQFYATKQHDIKVSKTINVCP